VCGLALLRRPKPFLFFVLLRTSKHIPLFFSSNGQKKKENSYGAVVKKKDEKIAGREGAGGSAGGYV
jgi:hypothetical protein